MIDKALLAKIRKCLALAKSANEHEAAAALATARRLMEAHGIDDELLTLADIEESTARASRTMRPPRWESILAATVCHALSVSQYLDDRGDRCFVGRAPLAEVATYAFAVLFRQLKAARSKYIAEKLRRCGPARKRSRADVFCEGWSLAVFLKVRELIAEPAEDPAIQQYLAVQHPGLVPLASRAATAKRADQDYWNGRAKGHAVELNVGVAGAAAPLALG